MIVLGIDLGSSSVKLSLFDAEKGESIANVSYPPEEMKIVTPQDDWAEQDPELWMTNIQKAIYILQMNHRSSLKEVSAIGISYQMHGLVVVDKTGNPLRNAIIWCDSRAVSQGDKAFNDLGEKYCLSHLLNSPGNFTASKLKWVKDYESGIYNDIHKIMLPGDFVAFRLTNEIRSTRSGMSEGIMWDFENNSISSELLNYYGFSKDILPELVDTFSIQGFLTKEMADKFGMKEGTPVTYRAGDQPNNALSLNVFNPGEVAATAGTSGVVYGVTDKKDYDPKSRVNTFLHVNNSDEARRLGVLLCLNSVGIFNSWAKNQIGGNLHTYEEMNEMAAKIAVGSEGLLTLPFGNGAERMLENKNIGASFHGLNLIKHKQPHIIRSIHEGIAFAFNYGLEIIEGLGLDLNIIRAGKANMFQSNVFVSTLANVSGAKVELYNTDGAEGAARGATIGKGFYKGHNEAFSSLKVVETVSPTDNNVKEHYQNWKSLLEKILR